MVIIKLVAIAAAIVAFYAIFVFGDLFSNWLCQGLILLGFLIWNTVRFSPRNTLSSLAFVLPFCIFLVGFGLIFDLFALYGRSDWLRDSLHKSLVFPNTFYIIKILISYIDYADITRLPVRMKTRLLLVALKSSCEKGGEKLSRFKWYAEIDPLMQTRRSRWIPLAVERYSVLMLSLYLFLYQEIQLLTEVVQNRFDHYQHGKEK